MSAHENSVCILKMKSKVLYPVAVIDVGSNSVRLMVDTGTKKEKYLITTRLAEGKIESRLANASILRTVNAVVLLFEKAIKSGCKSVFIFATAAVRNSENGKDFIFAVKKLTGLDVDVVSGEIEAELAVLGALKGQNGGVIDIGGASTEVAFSEDGQIVYSVSYKVGAVSLFGDFMRERDKIKDYLGYTVKGVRRLFKGDFYAIGGTVTTLASIDLKLSEYEPQKTNGHYLSLNAIKNISNELFSLTPQEIATLYPTAKSRADVIAGGSEILISVLTAYGINGVIVSESDNLEGYLECVLKNEERKD